MFNSISASRTEQTTWLATTIKTFLSIALVALVFYKVGFSSTITKLQQASLYWLLLALGCYLSGVLVRAYRWQQLLHALNIKIGLARLSWLYFIGFFFNQLVPTGIGGDVMRAYALAKDGTSGAHATSSVIIDRATGLYSLLIMGTITVLVQPALTNTKVTLLLFGLTLSITVATIIFSILTPQRFNLLSTIVPQKLSHPLEQVYLSLRSYKVRSLLIALFISLLFNLQLIITNILLAKAFNIELSIWYFFLFIPLISATLILPISINGLGAREWAYVILFAQAGINQPEALALSLGFYCLNLFMALIGGALLILQNLQQSE